MTSSATAEAPGKAQDVKGSRSLWADAWRRLLKNRLAVVGMIWLALMSVVAALAPWIVPFDPQKQEWWIGKRGPLFSHPTVELDMSFNVGSPAPQPFPKTGDHEIKLKVDEYRSRDARIEVGPDKLVKRIELGPDYEAAMPQPESPASFPVQENERLLMTIAGAKVVIVDALIEVGKPAPPEITVKDTVVIGEWRKGEKQREVVAKVQDGKIASLTVDGESKGSMEVTAGDIAAAFLDGKSNAHTHALGTDEAGRDILSRVIFGGRISLLVGIVATVVSLVIGVSYGAISGYAGGKVDEIMMRIVDILYAIPFMFFVIILLVLFGRSLLLMFAAIGAVEWLTMARIVRGQVLSLKEKEFVEAAKVSGSSAQSIVFGHLIPNSLGAVIVYTTLTIPEVILTEAFLSFLGLSVQYEGQALESWGSLTESGLRLSLGGFPWLLVWSAFALSTTLFALNFLGDGLRDALDPRLRGKG